MSIRFRTTAVALLVAAAGLSACAEAPTSPIAPEQTKVSADVDSLKRVPTMPWN